jgi:hypothetical protein
MGLYTLRYNVKCCNFQNGVSQVHGALLAWLHKTVELPGATLEVRVRTSGSGSCEALNPDPNKGPVQSICMNLNLNIGSGACANPVRHVHGPDRGQSSQQAQVPQIQSGVREKGGSQQSGLTSHDYSNDGHAASPPPPLMHLLPHQTLTPHLW